MFVRSPSVRHLGPPVSKSMAFRGARVCLCVCLDWSDPDPVERFRDKGLLNTHTDTYLYIKPYTNIQVDFQACINIQLQSQTHTYARTVTVSAQV